MRPRKRIKLPGLDTSGTLAPAVEQLVDDAGARERDRIGPRELVVETGATLALVGAVLAIDAAFPEGGLEIGPALALTVAYAITSRVRFYVGAGFTAPTQLVLVTMLFALPAALVPLFVALGYSLGRLPEVLARKVPADRLLVVAPGGWHAVGPALVFAAAGVGDPEWSEAPVYLLAFAAQLGGDLLSALAREWLALGISPRLQITVLARVYMVDALLTPIGLIAAFAAADDPYRALLVLPLVALMAVFAQEREQHLEHAIQLSNAYRGTALLLGDVLEDKDAYTASHSHGVVTLSLAVSDRLRLDPAARRRVEFGALLHDIGKIAVPAEIINKPGPLDDDEWSVMKLHTVEGQQMLDRVGGVLGEVGRVVRSSHEHYDGSGYPDRLRGDQIPIEARVVTCCDAFSAMTTTRSYRQAMSLEAAREELVRNSGTQFDPQVVHALLQIIDEEHVVVAPPLDVEPPAPAHSSP